MGPLCHCQAPLLRVLDIFGERIKTGFCRVCLHCAFSPGCAIGPKSLGFQYRTLKVLAHTTSSTRSKRWRAHINYITFSVGDQRAADGLAGGYVDGAYADDYDDLFDDVDPYDYDDAGAPPPTLYYDGDPYYDEDAYLEDGGYYETQSYRSSSEPRR